VSSLIAIAFDKVTSSIGFPIAVAFRQRFWDLKIFGFSRRAAAQYSIYDSNLLSVT
jgi:hypothetical protein